MGLVGLVGGLGELVVVGWLGGSWKFCLGVGLVDWFLGVVVGGICGRSVLASGLLVPKWGSMEEDGLKEEGVLLYGTKFGILLGLYSWEFS